MQHIKSYTEYESLNENALTNFMGKVLGFVIGVPIFANMNTKQKLKVFHKAVDKWIKNRAEYEILNDIQYDIEIPSEILKIKKRMRELNKPKSPKNLIEVSDEFCKLIKFTNYVNFRNRIDKDWLCDEVKKYCSSKNTEEEIKDIKKYLKYNTKTNKVEYIEEDDD